DSASHHGASFAELERFDFDFDGHEEIYVTSNRAAILLSPEDGGTIAAIDFRPAGVTLINSLMRRPETYHARLGQTNVGLERVSSIHDQVCAKETGLEKRLRYDRWARHSFRLLVFPQERSQEDYEKLRLGENEAIAAGPFRVCEATPAKVNLAMEALGGEWKAEKVFLFSFPDEGFRITCDLTLTYEGKIPAKMDVGLEIIVNFLAPDAPDRYIELAGKRYPMRWSGAAPASELRLVDKWQKIRVTVQAPDARDYWVAPVETISESEEGFERVYQGSQVLAVWPVEFQPGRAWTGRLIFTVSPVH
ncbi:MAG: alpha-amylase/4-alpha-glucanotransferase domain-containing protein, partial [Candidatus Acidiferrales bacterium]